MEALLRKLAGKVVTFAYEKDGTTEERMVEVEKVNDCNNGKKVMVGKDYHRNMQYRSFDLTKMSELNLG